MIDRGDRFRSGELRPGLRKTLQFSALRDGSPRRSRASTPPRRRVHSASAARPYGHRTTRHRSPRPGQNLAVEPRSIWADGIRLAGRSSARGRGQPHPAGPVQGGQLPPPNACAAPRAAPQPGKMRREDRDPPTWPATCLSSASKTHPRTAMLSLGLPSQAESPGHARAEGSTQLRGPIERPLRPQLRHGFGSSPGIVTRRWKRPPAGSGGGLAGGDT